MKHNTFVNVTISNALFAVYMQKQSKIFNLISQVATKCYNVYSTAFIVETNKIRKMFLIWPPIIFIIA